MTHVRGLVCRECGRGVPQSPIHVCEHCFGPLEVDYDYAAIRAVLTRDRVAAGPPSIWRYRDLLPLDERAAGGAARRHDAAGARAEPRRRLGASASST